MFSTAEEQSRSFLQAVKYDVIGLHNGNAQSGLVPCRGLGRLTVEVQISGSTDRVEQRLRHRGSLTTPPLQTPLLGGAPCTVCDAGGPPCRDGWPRRGFAQRVKNVGVARQTPPPPTTPTLATTHRSFSNTQIQPTTQRCGDLEAAIRDRIGPNPPRLPVKGDPYPYHMMSTLSPPPTPTTTKKRRVLSDTVQHTIRTLRASP